MQSNLVIRIHDRGNGFILYSWTSYQRISKSNIFHFSTLFFSITKYNFINKTTTTEILTCQHNHIYHFWKFFPRLLHTVLFLLLIKYTILYNIPWLALCDGHSPITWSFQCPTSSLSRKCKMLYLAVALLLGVYVFSCFSLYRYTIMRSLYLEFSPLSFELFP